jgi:hypothetical protein
LLAIPTLVIAAWLFVAGHAVRGTVVLLAAAVVLALLVVPDLFEARRPLRPAEIRRLLDLLQTDEERATVGRWLLVTSTLRQSDFEMVQRYAAARDRDRDLSIDTLACELDALRALANK